MLTIAHLVRRSAAAVLAATAACLLSGCSFLPQVPLDQPVSLSIRNGQPVVAWCGGEADVVRVRVYYGTATADDAQLVIDASGRMPVSSGAHIAPTSLPDDWHVEQAPYEGTELSEIGVTVNYESSEEGEEALPGNFMADFDLADGESLDSWPEGSWKWANGDLSSDPCGMPSASR
jgi:hypothetical protein